MKIIFKRYKKSLKAFEDGNFLDKKMEILTLLPEPKIFYENKFLKRRTRSKKIRFDTFIFLPQSLYILLKSFADAQTQSVILRICVLRKPIRLTSLMEEKIYKMR
jgi:hypothetical protein